MKRVLGLLPGVIAAGVAILFYVLGLWSGPERFFEDLLFSAGKARSDIVIVAIDNKSLKEVGQWPWRREEIAKFIDSVKELPPRTLGIDVIFAEPSRYGTSDDAILARALLNANFKIVMPIEADPLILDKGIPRANSLVTTLPEFKGPRVIFAPVNLITDPDSVVRRAPTGLIYSPTEEYYPSFAGEVAGNKDEVPKIERIAFAGPPGTIPKISFSDVLNDPDIRRTLEGKFVLLGSTATDLHDEQLTPFSRGVLMSGVEIQAEIANMFLTGNRLREMPRPLIVFWIFISGLLPALFFMYFRSVKNALAASLISGFILHVPLAIILFENSWVGNILHVNLAWVLGIGAAFLFRYYVLERERREIRHAFSKYVSNDVLQEILKDTSKIKLGGEEKEATVLFSDIRGFTTLSEKLTPVELTQFLNRYLTRMTDITLGFKGVVDKYIGDAIMVFWGAPLTNPKHVIHAMEASLAMIKELSAFNEESISRGDPPIDIGIGFNSGRVVAGNMGSEQRLDYTVMGDTVNLASRLEGQTKTYGAHIITSEFTLALVSPEELQEKDILVRELDRIRVKGKKMPVTIYEVMERERSEFIRSILPSFNALRKAYYEGDWRTCLLEAEEIFKIGEDGPTRVLLERAKQFLSYPPENWEGVYDMKTK